MITVGGFNTGIDRAVEAAELRLGAVNRVVNVRALPGGKGAHVALTVAALGVPVRLVGVVDALHGAFVSDFLAARGVEFHGFLVEGEIRSCLAIREDSGRSTEILEPGPAVDETTRREMLAAFCALSAGSEFAILSGSLPKGLDDDTYAALVTGLAGEGIRCLIDADGELLRRAVAARPYLIKPNREEAAGLAGRTLDSVAAAAGCARDLASGGGPRIVLSLGEDGALGLADGEVWHVKPPSVPVANTVGSGDCLLGGLAVGLVSGRSFEAALRLGVACGTANAMSRDTGIVARADVESLLPRLTASRLLPHWPRSNATTDSPPAPAAHGREP